MTRPLALCLLLLATPAQADGDTYSVRLAGLDAPESDQPCPVDAAGRLKALLPDIAVCRQVGMSWGRPVQQCTLHDGRDLGAVLVSEGMAFNEPRYMPDYTAQERRAKDRGLGVWGAGCERPWEWRDGQ